MADDKLANLSIVAPEPAAAARKKTTTKKPASTGHDEPKRVDPWPAFVSTATDIEIKKRFIREVSDIQTRYATALETYYCLTILDPETSIGPYDLDRIYGALSSANPTKNKDVLLVLLSQGGSIEAAYQISKVCKSFSKTRFTVIVPRQAKSAATLIAIGADQIHMGPLGQLGPIDPQLGGLPALGVSQALESIARLSERFPGSAEMFARYLRMALTVEQIGYCERICESAAQYAERLLSTKGSLTRKAAAVAKELVHEYKDHGFVIDLDEARQHMGSDWILSDTEEVRFAEELYSLFDQVNLFLSIIKSKRLLVIGDVCSETDILIFDRPKR